MRTNNRSGTYTDSLFAVLATVAIFASFLTMVLPSPALAAVCSTTCWNGKVITCSGSHCSADEDSCSNGDGTGKTCPPPL